MSQHEVVLARKRRPGFFALLLVEVVRKREEEAGYPEDSSAADAEAIRLGEDLFDRIVTRARSLPDSPALEAAIRAVRLIGTLLFVVLAAAAVVVGCAVAAKVLAATVPANLPLVLLSLVALNMVTLAIWLIAQFASDRIVGLGGKLFELLSWVMALPMTQRIAYGWAKLHGHPVSSAKPSSSAAPLVLRVLVADGRGRWLFGAVLHSLWLSFALASSLTLAVLLSLRSYDLSWETTLLSIQSLSRLARWLSVGPASLGLVATNTFAITDSASALARQYWSSWLVWATVVYGVLPRVIAQCSCIWLFWRTSRSMASDLSHPGFSRLRSRLLPDGQGLGVVDADASPPSIPTHFAVCRVPALSGTVHGLAMDGAGHDGPPGLPDVDWIWLGQVDELSDRNAALKRVRDERVAALAILVRATMTPDRGIEHRIGEFAQAAGVPPAVILQDLDQLMQRGSETFRRRLADWQSVVMRAGASGMVSAQGKPLDPVAEAGEGMP